MQRSAFQAGVTVLRWEPAANRKRDNVTSVQCKQKRAREDELGYVWVRSRPNTCL